GSLCHATHRRRRYGSLPQRAAHMPAKATDILNALLRGELAAAKTYEQALQHAGDEPEAKKLRRIQHDHHKAATTLQRNILQQGGSPENNSGVWGKLASAVESMAQLIGNTAALKALKEGEELGVKQYEVALKRTDLPAACKTVIQSTLLRRTQAHIPILDHLIERNHEA